MKNAKKIINNNFLTKKNKDPYLPILLDVRHSTSILAKVFSTFYPSYTSLSRYALNLCCHDMPRDILIDYGVLQTNQEKLIFICVWTELAGLDSAKTALKFK